MIKPKPIATTVLLAFVLVSIGSLIVKEIRHGVVPEEPQSTRAAVSQVDSPDEPTSSAPQSRGASHQVIVYYFHGTARCPSCLKIEAYAKEAVLDNFADAIEDGRVEWRVVNTDEPGNEHFVGDYQLYTKSVVVVDARDNRQIRWKNLERVWELLHDKEAFIAYICDEVGAYLGESR